MFVEYIWIDGTTPTQTLRSKTRIMDDKHKAKVIKQSFNTTNPIENPLLPAWSFDGSSTNQAAGDDSDCVLVPVYVVPDPIRGAGNYLAMCEVFNADGKTPHASNTRAGLRAVFNDPDFEGAMQTEFESAWFGYEQEYTLFAGATPLGFSNDRRFPAAQGPYYCGVGSDQVYGRELVEEHAKACFDAGLTISGINAEVMPGQWEFQIGPVTALEGGDMLWIARWLLYRIGETYGVNATLDPKPVPGDWNGAGMHTNFSTENMRNPGGMDFIKAFCDAAGQTDRINAHLAAYGDGLELRLTGKHETCSMQDYKYGVSDRTASIRIPVETAKVGYGYLEDRRPNANACPYAVATEMLTTSAISRVAMLSKASKELTVN